MTTANWTVDNWINLGNAISTFLAVVVAVGLAVIAYRKTGNDATSRAKLAAAGIVARLTSVGDQVHSMRAMIVFSQAGSDITVLSNIRAVIQKDFYRPDQDTLSAMTPLPNQCAYRIASGYDYLDRLRINVSKLPPGLIMEITTREQRIHLLETWRADIDKACDQFTVAIRECVKASEMAAPPPDGNLLYGNDQLSGDEEH